jgi:hypothetical protein
MNYFKKIKEYFKTCSLLNDVKYSAIDIAEAEEPMTIVVEIKSSDGIVLASDSQFTAMYGKI